MLPVELLRGACSIVYHHIFPIQCIILQTKASVITEQHSVHGTDPGPTPTADYASTAADTTAAAPTVGGQEDTGKEKN